MLSKTRYHQFSGGHPLLFIYLYYLWLKVITFFPTGFVFTCFVSAFSVLLITRYKKLLRTVDLTKDFFFSYSYHVMLSLQKNLSNHETGLILYETMFVWNEFLTRGIRNNLKNSDWTVALVYGFFKQVFTNKSSSSRVSWVSLLACLLMDIATIIIIIWSLAYSSIWCSVCYVCVSFFRLKLFLHVLNSHSSIQLDENLVWL